MYKAVKVSKGSSGWGGPLVIQPTEKRSKIVSVTGGGIDPLTKRIAELTAENDMNISACVDYANRHGLDLYVSLHCDWNEAPSGTYPIVHPNSDSGYRLAQCINASVMLRMGIGTRGILKRDDWEVTDTNMTACIFETGSIRADINTLLNASAYGQAVAYGILDYLGIAYDGNAPRSMSRIYAFLKSASEVKPSPSK